MSINILSIVAPAVDFRLQGAPSNVVTSEGLQWTASENLLHYTASPNLLHWTATTMSGTAKQVPIMGAGESRNASVDFTDQLDDSASELLTGTPTVAVSPAGPAITSEQVNTGNLTINGENVTAGKGVQFHIGNVTADVLYTFTVTAGTDSTPAETLVLKTKLQGV